MTPNLRSLSALALLLPYFLSSTLAFPSPHAGASPDQPFFDVQARNNGGGQNSNSSSSSNGGSTLPAGLHFATDYYPEAWVDEPDLAKNDVQRQKDAKLTYIRIGEFIWSTIEPEDGKYDWTLLDRAIEEIGNSGMKVILGTPTATPPRWATTKYDIYGQDPNHFNRIFGSRRHYSTSSPDYQMLSKRITEQLAKRYGSNPHVGMWQQDNEMGCHDTVRTYDKHAEKAFQQWLQKKYGSVENMNKAQGTKYFWSMGLNSFDDMPLPTQSVTENNPAVRLDFYEFSSDQTINFAKEQFDIIRKYRTVNQVLTTNFMGYFNQFDHHRYANETGIEAATWDSYPLGNTEQFDWVSDADKVKYSRQGRPDAQSWHHRLYAGVAGNAKGQNHGDWGIMEQQPGPVNWAPSNPSPLLGMVRLWLHEIFAHGGSMANIFRWREAAWAQEQMHAGMLLRDGNPDVALIEQQQVATEDMPKLMDAGLLKEQQGDTGTTVVWSDPTPARKVAVVYDYYSGWVLEANPQGGTWDTNTFSGGSYQWNEINGFYYSALRRLGIDADVVGPSQDLSQYDLVVVPNMAYVGPAFEQRLQAYNGSIVFGPRSASKVQTLSIPEGLPPAAGPVRDRLPIYVRRVESLRNDLNDKVSFNGKDYPVKAWSEWVDCSRNNQTTSMPVEATFSGYRNGAPATCAHKTEDGRVSRYIAYYGDVDFLTQYLGKVAAEAGVKNFAGKTVDPSTDLGTDLRFARQGNALFAFNYGPESVDVPASALPEGAQVVVGNASSVPAAGVAVWKIA